MMSLDFRSSLSMGLIFIAICLFMDAAAGKDKVLLMPHDNYLALLDP